MVPPGSPTKIISFIGDDATIQNPEDHFGTCRMNHCGKWKEALPRPPPQISVNPAKEVEEVTLDYDFTFDNLSACFEQNCI